MTVARGRAACTAALLLVLAGCGQTTAPGGDGPAAPGPGAATGGTVPGTTGAFVAGVPPCDDVPPIRAEESAYRESPAYGNADGMREEVLQWAQGQRGFSELWLDRERNGWITVGFTGVELEPLEAEVAERWPEEGVVVVEMPHSAGELEALQRRVHDAMTEAGARIGSTAAYPDRGVVGVGVGVLTPEKVQVLEGFAGEPLCLDGAIDPAAAPTDGPQPEAGEGWRLLGEDERGEVYRTGVASTDEQLEQLWAEADLGGAAPEVDWEREIAVWFGAVYGTGCPVRLDGVVVTGDLLHAELSSEREIYACPDDANPHAFVVAVERTLLPEGPFRVQLEAREPFGGAPEERTVVSVDLSTAASTASDDEIGLDEELMGPRETPLVEDGDALTPDQTVRYVYRAPEGCQTPVLGPFADGVRWRLADQESPWTVEEDDEIHLYPMAPEDRLLLVSGPQMDWSFVPLPDGQSCPE